LTGVSESEQSSKLAAYQKDKVNYQNQSEVLPFLGTDSCEKNKAGRWWFTTVILATQEAEIRRIAI
jgi:hypothetical protein